jgi:hypothetical protein
MRRARVISVATAAAAAALLTLSACGGGGGGSSDRQASIDALMEEISADGGMTEEQQGCIRTGLEGLSDDELETLKTGENDSDVPAELQDKVVTFMTDCLMPE